MEELEERRKKYLADAEQQRRIEELDEMAKIAREVSKIDREKCRDFYIKLYTRTGSFNATYVPHPCSTGQLHLKYPDVMKNIAKNSKNFRIIVARSEFSSTEYYAELHPEALIAGARVD